MKTQHILKARLLFLLLFAFAFANAQLVITPTITPSCKNDGVVTINYTGGNGTASFYLSDLLGNNYSVHNSPTFTNLHTGYYNVFVLSGMDSAFASFSIPSVISAQSSITNATCPLNNGSITITVSGGTPPYNYAWSNGATTASVNNLSAGNYFVSMTDANGCRIAYDTLSMTVSSLSGLSVSIPDTGGLCTHAFSADVTGGIAPYAYSWSTGETTKTISNILQGNYMILVTVTDAQGCLSTAQQNVNTSLNVTDSASILSNYPTCIGNDGSLTVNMILGSVPYHFVWSTGDTTSSVSHLSAGTYTVTVTDAHGCSGQLTSTLNGPNQLQAYPNWYITHAPACGLSNGVAMVDVEYGTTPFTYQWTNNISTSDSATNLAAGSYIVTVTDVNGCKDTALFTLVGKSNLQLQITTTPADCDTTIHNGSATAIVTGGAPPYQYKWYNDFNFNNVVSTSQTITGQRAYQFVVVEVTDNLNCVGNDSFSYTYIPVNCPPPAGCKASFGILPDSSTAHLWNVYNYSSSSHPLSYVWNWGDGSTSTGVAPSHTYSTAGYYDICLYVNDGNGCSDTYCDSSAYVFKTDEVISMRVIDRTNTGATGITTISETVEWKVYPNPSNGIFVVKLSKESLNRTIEVCNLLGETVWSTKTPGTTTPIDLSSQANGIYMVRIKEQNQILTQKIVKQ